MFSSLCFLNWNLSNTFFIKNRYITYSAVSALDTAQAFQQVQSVFGSKNAKQQIATLAPHGETGGNGETRKRRLNISKQQTWNHNPDTQAMVYHILSLHLSYVVNFLDKVVNFLEIMEGFVSKWWVNFGLSWSFGLWFRICFFSS